MCSKALWYISNHITAIILISIETHVQKKAISSPIYPEIRAASL